MKKAFTLIEALVVVGILIILLIMSIPAYRSYSKRNELRNAAEKIRQAIIEAQNMALAPKDSGEQLQYGSKSKNIINSNQYSNQFIVYKKIGSVETELKTYSLPSNVEWANSSNWDVSFTPPYAKSSCNKVLEISLKLKNSSETISINLNCKTGQINITSP